MKARCGTITTPRFLLDYSISLVTLTKRIPDNNKHDDSPKTATTEFLSAIAGNQCPKKIVHIKNYKSFKLNNCASSIQVQRSRSKFG